MKINFKYVLPCLLCLRAFILSSQNIDSLKLVLKNAKEDTSKLEILQFLAENINDEKIWTAYNDQAFKLSEKLLQSNDQLIIKKAKKAQAHALSNFAYSYNIKGAISEALEYYEKSLLLQTEVGDRNGEAESINNIGFIYNNLGDISKALNYFERSLKLSEEIGDKGGVALALNNLGFIYAFQNDPNKALEYHKKSLKIAEGINDKNNTSTAYNNIGSIYFHEGKMDEALNCFFKSLNIREEIDDKQGVAYCLTNIGSIYSKKRDVPNELKYYTEGLKIQKELGDKRSIANSFNNISVAYYSQKKYPLAQLYADSSGKLSKELGFPELIRHFEEISSNLNAATGNYKEAFEHYKQFIIYRDSINNEGTRKASIKNQLNYEFAKKEAVIKEQREKERIVAEEKNRFQKIVICAVIAGLLLVVVFAIFVFRSLKTTKQQKLIIEEKQKEILDSIHYAKRIQTSLLPTEKYMEKNLKH